MAKGPDLTKVIVVGQQSFSSYCRAYKGDLYIQHLLAVDVERGVALKAQVAADGKTAIVDEKTGVIRTEEVEVDKVVLDARATKHARTFFMSWIATAPKSKVRFEA